MALPPGIVTRTLTVSPGYGTEGQRASLEILVTPFIPTVVWAPTASPVVTFFSVVRTGPDQAAILYLPAVDQTGFIDENQNPISDWAYKVTARYLLDGRKVGQTVTKYFKPMLSSPMIQDFDIIPTGVQPLYQGPQGPAGLSAYQVALANGFVGSEAAWLASLATGGVTPFYEHIQSSPSDTWLITHNLGYYPGGVTTVNSANQEFKGEVTYIDQNSLRINMVGAQSGIAHLS